MLFAIFPREQQFFVHPTLDLFWIDDLLHDDRARNMQNFGALAQFGVVHQSLVELLQLVL
jgi:hypothetical protein